MMPKAKTAHEAFDELNAALGKLGEQLRRSFNPWSLSGFAGRLAAFADRTFGEGPHTEAIIDHIGKELDEIRADPEDYHEWIDVIILALDGYRRHGGTDVESDLQRKLEINERRKWPSLEEQRARGMLAVEHIRSGGKNGE